MKIEERNRIVANLADDLTRYLEELSDNQEAHTDLTKKILELRIKIDMLTRMEVSK